MTQYKANLGVAVLTASTLLLSACASPPATTPAPSGTIGVSGGVSSAEDVLEPLNSLAEAQALAGDIILREDAPLRYVVKKGDTLWAISNRYLADAWQWPEIWYVNGKLADPHQIFPGDVLELHNVRGKLKLARALERVSPRIRDSAFDNALPAIPIDVIRNFLRGPRLVDAETLNAAPYVLAFSDEHIIGGAGMGVFVKNIPNKEIITFSVVRKGVVYKDPDTGELLGYEAIPTGEADIRTFGQPAEAILSESAREVQRGDRLLPVESENFKAHFYPHAPTFNVDGKIISVYGGISQIAQFQIVAINRGARNGIEPGHVLQINQVGRVTKDPYTNQPERLPDQNAGLLMVFKVTPKVSYGLVMTASRPVHVLDKVEQPISLRRR